MAECMTFPKTADEFIEQYSFKDEKQEYTNGAELIPVFRVKQMMEHYCHAEVVRCKDCKHWLHMEAGFGDCTNGRFHLDGHVDPTMKAEDFCSCGERRGDK